MNDPFRFKYKNEKCYTWSCDSSGIKTRLDRFYIDKGFLKNLENVRHIHCNVSDNLGVKIEFNELPNINFKIAKGLWKLNTAILEDIDFHNEIEEQWYRLNLNITENEKNWEWWDKVKLAFKNVAIKHSKQNEVNFRQKLREMEEGIKQLDTLLLNSNNNDLTNVIIEEKNCLKEQIDLLYRNKLKGALIRSKCEILTNNENPSSNFLRMEAKNSKKIIIKNVKNETGTLTKNTNETLQACEIYYRKLYHYEEIDEDIANDFTNCLPQVPRDMVNMCDRYISLMELFEALINMKNGKSPGSDGLPAEFYKHFWYLIGDTFCNIVNRTLHYENELSSTQRLSIIKIFHKNGKEKTDLGNYRPISLLNTDYKIIAKTLANRLKKVLPYYTQ